MIHVYPEEDERPHDLEGTGCACGPDVHYKDPDTGETYSEALVVHHAFDFRELIEEAERIKACV